MLTIDRVAGAALAVLALGVIEETWRLALPLGSLHNPGPGYTPVLLAVVLLAFGAALMSYGGGATRLG
ncbi:MAG TPA: hypothetical protein VLA62_02220, partial [Solirubrobacterales bacterium]|nr:hypothetical protein [Solirubrobacterales bacterium]